MNLKSKMPLIAHYRLEVKDLRKNVMAIYGIMTLVNILCIFWALHDDNFYIVGALSFSSVLGYWMLPDYVKKNKSEETTGDLDIPESEA